MRTNRPAPVDARKRTVAELETSALFLISDLSSLIDQAKRAGDAIPPAVVRDLIAARKLIRTAAVAVGA